MEKLYSFIILTAVVAGILLGQADAIQMHADSAIVPLLVAMLFVIFLQIPLEDIKKSVKNVRFTATSVIINFVWTPLLAWILAMIFLSGHPALYIGFIMLMVTPCTDWYIIFTGIARGNVALSTAILPLNLILQIVLLPFYLLMFGGATGAVDLSLLWESVLMVLVIPLVLALIVKAVLHSKQKVRNVLFEKISPLPIVFLSLAILAMFASHGQILLENLQLLLIIALPLLLFFAINFIVSQKAGQLIGFSYADKASLSLTSLARNSPIVLAIAMTAFPDEPLIALTLVIGPLLELPILAGMTQLLLASSGKNSDPG